MVKHNVTKKDDIKSDNSKGINDIINIINVEAVGLDIKQFIDKSEKIMSSHICFVVPFVVLNQFIMQNKNILYTISDLKIVNVGMIEKNFRVFINTNPVKLSDVQAAIQTMEQNQTDIPYNYKDVCYNHDFFKNQYNKIPSRQFNKISLSINSPTVHTPKFVKLLENINNHGERQNIIYLRSIKPSHYNITRDFLIHYFEDTANVKIYTNTTELFPAYGDNPIIHFYNMGDHVEHIINLFIPPTSVGTASNLLTYFYIYYYDNDNTDIFVYKSLYQSIKNKMEFTKNFFTENEN